MSTEQFAEAGARWSQDLADLINQGLKTLTPEIILKLLTSAQVDSQRNV